MTAALARLKDRIVYSEFLKTFNLRTDESKGRSMILISNLITGIVNIMVTGVFYTGFLAVNGIDIVRVGVIAFIPYISMALSLFSPRFLSLFKKRRILLIFNNVFYWGCVVLATTIMPFFVEDSGWRTIWFAVFLFLGSACNALLGSGAAAWQIHFIPKNQKQRGIYFSYLTLSATVISAITAVISSLVADAIGGQAQAAVINTMRFVAFGLMMVNAVALYGVPREYDYPAVLNVRLRDVFTVPLKSKKFVLTMLMAIFWNFNANVNSSTWPYFAMHTIGINYLTMYTGTFVCAITGIFLLPAWREAIRKFSWQKVLLFVIFVFAALEFCIGFATEYTKWVYVAVAAVSGANSVGINLVFASLFYINLPKKSNTDLYYTLWVFIVNITVMLSTMLGAWFIMITEPRGPWTLFGLPFYGSQFLVWGKSVMHLLFCGFIMWAAPRTQPDPEEAI